MNMISGCLWDLGPRIDKHEIHETCIFPPITTEDGEIHEESWRVQPQCWPPQVAWGILKCAVGSASTSFKGIVTMAMIVPIATFPIPERLLSLTRGSGSWWQHWPVPSCLPWFCTWPRSEQRSWSYWDGWGLMVLTLFYFDGPPSSQQSFININRTRGIEMGI